MGGRQSSLVERSSSACSRCKRWKAPRSHGRRWASRLVDGSEAFGRSVAPGASSSSSRDVQPVTRVPGTSRGGERRRPSPCGGSPARAFATRAAVTRPSLGVSALTHLDPQGSPCPLSTPSSPRKRGKTEAGVGLGVTGGSPRSDRSARRRRPGRARKGACGSRPARIDSSMGPLAGRVIAETRRRRQASNKPAKRTRKRWQARVNGGLARSVSPVRPERWVG